jgi:hypothetical protein
MQAGIAPRTRNSRYLDTLNLGEAIAFSELLVFIGLRRESWNFIDRSSFFL